MGKEADDAAQAVRDAIRALEAISDVSERAEATTKLLREWPELHRLVKEIRQQAVITWHEQGTTYAEIGEALQVERERAWQIGRGQTRRKAPRQQDPDGGQ
jgi:DNA-directed RNA polymerase sigma subunit (sigma70/sigma32)